MKCLRVALLTSFWGLIPIGSLHSQSRELADQCWEKAEQLRKQEKYLDAAQSYLKSVEAEIGSPNPRLNVLVAASGSAGAMFDHIGQYEKAITFYEFALLLDRKRGREPDVATRLNKIGMAYHSWGKYDSAIKSHEKALSIDRKLGRKPQIATSSSNIGRAYYSLKEFDKAIECFEEALSIDKNLGSEAMMAGDLSNIGAVYYSRGQHEVAIKYYREALAISEKLGSEADVVTTLDNIGAVYNSWGQHDMAIRSYEQALAISRKLGRDSQVAAMLNNIGDAYRSWNQFDEAIRYYKESQVISRRLGSQADVLTTIDNIASVYESSSQYDKAIKYYEEALSIDRKLGREAQVATRFNNIGRIYHNWGQYDKAIIYFQEALSIDKRLGKEDDVAVILNNVASVYESSSQYDKAMKYYEEALSIDRKLGREAQVATRFNNIGMLYKMWGQYDKAIKYYEEALSIDRKLGKESEVASILNNIGGVYLSWGHYDRAVKYYEESLVISKKLNSEAEVAKTLNNIGGVYSSWGQYDKAIRYYEEALSIAKKLGRKAEVATIRNNIAGVYRDWGQFDKAIKNFEESLMISRALGREAEAAKTISNIGLVYRSLGQYDKAIKNYKEALAIQKKLGTDDDSGATLSNIGASYCELRNYDAAIENLEASIKIIEQTRRTAKGDIRREYLARQISTYQRLMLSYFAKRDFSNMYMTAELSRAKLLSERLAGSEDKIDIPSLRQVQKELPEDGAIIIYMTIPSNTIAMLITQKDSHAMALDDSKFLSFVRQKLGPPILELLGKERGIMVTNKERESKKPDGSQIDLDDVVNYYRILLTNSISSADDEITNTAKPGLRKKHEGTSKLLQFTDISKALYDFLIQPMVSRMQGAKCLLIVPDGILALLPFETLIDSKGHCLVESSDVSYVQSLGVLDLLRKRNYLSNRKPLLALGGAVYDEQTYTKKMITNERQLNALSKEVYSQLKDRGSLKKAYSDLGLSSWKNLPGTLSEVNSIARVVYGSKIITGKDVNEKHVKSLSTSGELANYRTIHIASHGIVVPEIPDLSAIVLSQSTNESESEDGYLCMGEIAELRLKADFVNLSACETGLGRLYKGEGVVGLTQSFLLAGANGLSVSLWRVADEPTSQYMSELYTLVEHKGFGYAQAMNEIKRRFLRGDFGNVCRAPYYWAPFVYYGR
jgi:tetratricopeptide (TPR) repeat protein/CHAT domain-containing protein